MFYRKEGIESAIINKTKKHFDIRHLTTNIQSSTMVQRPPTKSQHDIENCDKSGATGHLSMYFVLLLRDPPVLYLHACANILLIW